MLNEERILDILVSIQGDVSGMKGDIADLKKDVSELKTDVAGLKTDVADLKQNVARLNDDVAVLKTDVSDLKQNVARLNDDMEYVKDDLVKLGVTMENDIMLRIDVLGEGQRAMLDVLVPAARVEALEEDVALLKLTSNHMSAEIQALKKAQ